MERISLKRPWHFIPRILVGLAVFLSFFCFFTFFSILNMIEREALIRSGLWFLFAGTIATVLIRDKGLTKSGIALLGLFARDQFIEVTEYPNQNSESSLATTQIVFGYQLLTRAFYYLKVDIDKIVCVIWIPGQGADPTGKGAYGWSLWIDYEVGDEAKQPVCEENHLVGDGGSRLQMEALGRRLVALLENAGANFTEVHEKGLTRFRRTETRRPAI